MSEKLPVTMSNTKKEMLEAYNTLREKLEAKEKLALKPEKKIEAKKIQETVKAADTLSSEGVVKEIASLKLEIGKVLSQLSEKLECTVNQYDKLQQAISIKETELKEVYEIDKSAHSLAALIDAQRQRKEEFELEMEKRKKDLFEEINNSRDIWEKEKKAHTELVKERDGEEKRKREREKEEYKYSFQREQELTQNKFADEKAQLEKRLLLKREESEKQLSEKEKELTEREKIISEREKDFDALQKKVESFPKELEAAVSKATRETTHRLQYEAESRKNLLEKEFEGEKKVLLSKIEALEKNVVEQNILLEKLSEQQEKSYQKVQEIAMKAIDGSHHSKVLSGIEQILSEKHKNLASD